MFNEPLSRLRTVKNPTPMDEETERTVQTIKEEDPTFSCYMGLGPYNQEEAVEFIQEYKKWKGEGLPPTKITHQQWYTINASRHWAGWEFTGKTRQDADEYIESYFRATREQKLEDPNAIKHGTIGTNYTEIRKQKVHAAQIHIKSYLQQSDCENCMYKEQETCENCPKYKFTNLYGE